ncbi:hypothetical protein IPH70_01115 [Candidatus Roizmanbacteria bacterium]|nr:MAG: hypothetical protein IPH70_01115 [Candidatus Roizmanbacteria bacterium]
MKLLKLKLTQKPYHFTELNLLDKNAIVAFVKEVKVTKRQDSPSISFIMVARQRQMLEIAR